MFHVLVHVASHDFTAACIALHSSVITPRGVNKHNLKLLSLASELLYAVDCTVITVHIYYPAFIHMY